MSVLVLAAAGKGSRLCGRHGAKPLVTVHGKPMVDYVFDAFPPSVCPGVILLTRPEHRLEWETWVKPERSLTRVEDGGPTVAHTVLAGLREVQRQYPLPPSVVWVVWSDMVHLEHPMVAVADMWARHLANDSANFHKRYSLVLPVAYVQKPYVSLAFQGTDTLREVRLARRGDAMPVWGIADCGMFGFLLRGADDLGALVDRLEDYTLTEAASEWWPFLVKIDPTIFMLPVDASNARSINTPAELMREESSR